MVTVALTRQLRLGYIPGREGEWQQRAILVADQHQLLLMGDALEVQVAGERHVDDGEHWHHKLDRQS